MPALRIYLDTDGLLELITPDSPEEREHFKSIADALAMGDLLFVTSEVTILEALVHAVQDNDAAKTTPPKRVLHTVFHYRNEASGSQCY